MHSGISGVRTLELLIRQQDTIRVQKTGLRISLDLAAIGSSISSFHTSRWFDPDEILVNDVACLLNKLWDIQKKPDRRGTTELRA
jgi:hypothetical protein